MAVRGGIVRGRIATVRARMASSMSELTRRTSEMLMVGCNMVDQVVFVHVGASRVVNPGWVFHTTFKADSQVSFAMRTGSLGNSGCL